ncbi:MAG: hypothetical protein E6Q97_03545 [Desulfurellales bacterium]|nr:MAG: hypothetical protein E6Q97_03545 [Desulfurellales bacterium]
MTDRFDDMARAAMESKLCIDSMCSYPNANNCGCYAALLDMYKAGQEAMRKASSVYVERAVKDVRQGRDLAVGILSLPIEDTP